MYNSSHSPVPTESNCEVPRSSFGRREDLAYQATTIGAIVIVLISLWVF